MCEYQRGGYVQRGPLAQRHLSHAQVPALNHLAGADLEDERLAALA